ncbi:PucR family transcriptional regulator ligand-binding domain-containing protein [Lentilactobacillus parabuchneri]|uniref:PucR family transcriptional regulator n=1 Tax=Lentilactobacillus parabuchneri TaxID=152331 RepID=UPI00080B73CB|nr:PucR family transcriptional regulator [Lentilactobacillus parabuchneri]MBW0223157.1 PucR family transcriptional regulator ligand-binding domain-containing protein [Lentilactobacillus parabuchneri]OCB79164.1 sugar diacid utilization regulator [Lentilactobacillus parabuchneri]
MIDLEEIITKEKKRIVQVNKVPLNNRKVNAITIMDSGTVDGWAKNGEIVITSSRMMPEDMGVAKQLLAQLVEKGVVALMVKPYSPDGTGEFPQVLIDYGNQLNFPLFKIEPSATYIQILNDINALLLENRRINKMADLDLDYLLKSNSASDKDFDFVSGLKDINLYELNVRVTKIVLGETPKPGERLSIQFDLVNQIQAFFDRVQREGRIKTYFILESSNGATAISFFSNDQVELPPHDRTPYTRLIHNVHIPRFIIYEGVSNAYPAKKIHRCYIEASFGVEIAQTLDWSDRPVFYRDVGLWKLVQKLSRAQDSRLYPIEMDQILEDDEMFETVKEFFRQNESIKKASQAMFTHTNTIRYRLTMIYKQTGLDYRLTNDKFLIYIAFIKKLLNRN